LFLENGRMLGRNFIVKNVENFSERGARKSPENSLPILRNVKPK